MADSIDRLFPNSPAAGLSRGDQAAADQPPAAATFSVRPIPAFVVDSILERRLPGIREVANDRGDERLSAILDHDVRGYEAVAIVLGAFTLLLGLFAVAVL